MKLIQAPIMKHLAILLMFFLSVGIPSELAFASQLAHTNGGFHDIRDISIDVDGDSVVVVDDIDGDGINDFLSSLKGQTSWPPQSPSISAISGSSGDVLWTNTSAGEFVSVMDDVNVDGKGDILCKTDMEVLIIDFVTGNVIRSWAYTSAVNVVEIGDADSDGINDVCVWPTATGLEVYSAVGGTLIWDYQTSYHISVVSNIDSNQDGLNDIILGLGDYSGSGLTANGKILSLDGHDGTVLSEIEGQVNNANTGYYIRSIPDMNSDGVSEIFCLNGMFTNSTNVQAISVTSPMTSVWSNQVDFNYESRNEDQIAVVPLGDSNGDGIPELCVITDRFAQSGMGYGDYFAGHAFYLLDGSSGSQSSSANSRGTHWELVGDCNNDGLSEIAASGIIVEPWGNGPTSSLAVIDVVNSNNGWELYSWYATLGLGLQVYDFNDDGVLDIITCSIDDFNSGSGELIVNFYDSKTGALLLNDYSSGISGSIWYGQQACFTTQGDEVAILLGSDVGHLDTAIFLDKTHSPGITSSATMVSRGQVSRVEFDLDFHDSASYYLYSFLMSRVAGTTMIRDLSVPLGYDSWLVKSYLGMLPGVFNNATGILNSNGVSKVVLQLPANAIPASLVGTSLYFAAITKLAWAPQWEFSSVVNEVLITP
jgi:hypothetical protein